MVSGTFQMGWRRSSWFLESGFCWGRVFGVKGGVGEEEEEEGVDCLMVQRIGVSGQMSGMRGVMKTWELVKNLMMTKGGVGK